MKLFLMNEIAKNERKSPGSSWRRRQGRPSKTGRGGGLSRAQRIRHDLAVAKCMERWMEVKENLKMAENDGVWVQVPFPR